MKDNLVGALWRSAIFIAVCALGIFAMLAIFGQLRFDRQQPYHAQFTNVSGLADGNFVRIAGVEVGQVRDITVNPDSTVNVAFAVDDSVVLTDGTRAVIRYDDLIGGRYLALEPAAGSVARLQPGHTIPIERTRPALDLDALIGGFRPLFRALDPEQVNALSGQLIDIFEGQGLTINSFLAQTALLTANLADRDQLIGQVITNLNVVLGSLSGQRQQFDKAVDSLAQLVEGLADRRTDIANGVAYTNEAARSITDLLVELRPPLRQTVAQTDRTAGLTIADHEYFDNLLNTLPDKYRVLARQGIYGDFFSFYICDLVLKLNGKGGQPVYVKVVGQSTGRCAPK